MRLAAVLSGPGTCSASGVPHGGLAGSFAGPRPRPARPCSTTGRTFRLRLSGTPGPSSTTVIILDSNHGALIVWLKPMREGLPGIARGIDRDEPGAQPA